MTNRILSLIFVIATAGLLSACADTGHRSEADTLKRNTVEMVRLSHPLRFAADAEELSDVEKQSLYAFFQDIDVGYGDTLSIDLPFDDDGNVSELDQKRHAAMADFLKDHGLMLSADVTPYGLALAQDQARLIISRYTVVLPDCPDWSQDTTKNFGNAPTSNFGCAHVTNLGLMVANPRDLVIGQTYDGPNAAAAAKAVNKYMKGGQSKSSSSSTTSASATSGSSAK